MPFIWFLHHFSLLPLICSHLPPPIDVSRPRLARVSLLREGQTSAWSNSKPAGEVYYSIPRTVENCSKARPEISSGRSGEEIKFMRRGYANHQQTARRAKDGWMGMRGGNVWIAREDTSSGTHTKAASECVSLFLQTCFHVTETWFQWQPHFQCICSYMSDHTSALLNASFAPTQYTG